MRAFACNTITAQKEEKMKKEKDMGRWPHSGGSVHRIVKCYVMIIDYSYEQSTTALRFEFASTDLLIAVLTYPATLAECFLSIKLVVAS